MKLLDLALNEINQLFSLAAHDRLRENMHRAAEQMQENMETVACFSARDITPAEMDRRQAEADPSRTMSFYTQTELLRNRGMYSHAGMMNANRPNIMDRIIAAASYRAQVTGKPPESVYLGESEMRELRAYVERLKAMTGTADSIDEKVCGYDLVQVKKESYFAVH